MGEKTPKLESADTERDSEELARFAGALGSGDMFPGGYYADSIHQSGPKRNDPPRIIRFN